MGLYWDLQGAATIEGLKDSFLECLEDADTVAELLSLDVDDLESFAFAEIVNKFRRKAKSLKRRVLLLVDECEELVDVARSEPGVLSAFRKLSNTTGVTVVMAGSMRLMDLDESHSRTSPFLPDFLPPLSLGPFNEDISLQVLAKNGVGHDIGVRIHDLTLGNPHLVQVIGEHYLRLEDMDRVLSDLMRDKVCDYFFQSNFQCLPESMRKWLAMGEAVTRLSALRPGDPVFDYATHSSLLRLIDDEPVVSPLLIMVEGGGPPQAGPIEKTAAPPAESGAQTPIAEALIKRLDRPLSALPMAALLSGGDAVLDEALDPPSLNMLDSLQEPSEKIHAILDGASPEYVLGQPPDERTSVYLVGLYLYQSHFGRSPFASIEDPWERAAMIADCDVHIEPEGAAEAGLTPKRAMTLLRGLKARPSDRYAVLADFDRDWRQAG